MEVRTEKKITVEFTEEEALMLRAIMQNCPPEQALLTQEFYEELFCTLNVELEGIRR